MSTTSISGGGNHNVSVYGNGTVIAGSGNDAVRISGSGRVLIGSGRDTITVAGNGTVTAGNGNDAVGIKGNASVVIGNGRDSITVGGNGIISAGSGNDQIKITGAGHVTVGGGHDTLTLYGSGSIVERGILGRDTITLGTGSNTIVAQGIAVINASSPAATGRNGYGSASDGGSGDYGTRAALQLSRGLPASAAGSATVSGGEFSISHSRGVIQEIAVNGTMTLMGGNPATNFIGGTGTTVMKGASGHDTFTGGSGHDTMTGVGSHNVFQFVASEKGGHHVIMNFVAGDQLNVEGHSLAYLMYHHDVSSHGGNSFISVDGGRTSIELQGFTERQPFFHDMGDRR